MNQDNVVTKDFVNSVLELFRNATPGERAHTLVAYANTPALYNAIKLNFEREGQNFTIDDMIDMTFKGQERSVGRNDDIAARKWGWFVHSVPIYKMDHAVRVTSDYLDEGSEIWCYLVESAPVLISALPDNVIWTDMDKQWFKGLKGDKEYIEYALHFIMPKIYRPTDRIQKIIKSHEIRMI